MPVRRSVSPSRADIILVSPNDATRVTGLLAAVEAYRAIMVRAKIAWFASRDHDVTERGDAAMVEYRWDREWAVGGRCARATGARSWCSSAGMSRGGSSGAPNSGARLRGLWKQCGAG